MANEGKIYVNQDKLRITLVTGQTEVESASTLLIKYKTPDGVSSQFTASVLSASTGAIYYDVGSTNIIDIKGWWRFWAYATFNGGKSAPGEPVDIRIYAEGE